MILFRTLKRERTEHCKELRRKYGDYSGIVRFTDKKNDDRKRGNEHRNNTHQQRQFGI